MAHDRSHYQPLPVKEQKERKLFLGGLRGTVRESDIENYFSKFGEVEEAYVIRDERGNSRYSGYVIFKDKHDAASALQEDEHIIKGRGVDVKRSNRTLLTPAPKPPSRYQAAHPLDPLEYVEEDPSSREKAHRTGRSKFGFYDKDVTYERKRHSDMEKKSWKTAKATQYD